ncbi:MAG: CinA family nicotinamide mononucleotide deamidase-related protein [Bacteroidia bacterium]|nr:CinA family nicotinamide mononucleotide deamidase-related protein [Bacteroidia bacterium]
MNACIITIGDEILIGQTLDTNSQWISDQLTTKGINVKEMISISDEKEHILKTLSRCSSENDIVLITGGLGPTNDDITKLTLSEFTGSELQFRPEIFDGLKKYFEKRNKDLIEKNRSQAYLPVNAIAIPNHRGTASGMWIEHDQTVLVSMPGVPTEMKNMMLVILQMIEEKFDLPCIVFKHVLTASIAEAILSDQLQEFEEQLPKHVKLAYLPNLGQVKLRLTAKGDDSASLSKDIDREVQKLKSIIGKHIFGYNDDTLAGKLGLLLLNEQKSLATAESCTGGYIAHQITSIAGSSSYFKGSLIAYSNEIKTSILKVKEETIVRYGAVSIETVEEMLKGILELTGADYGIAVSGIAGPTGGSEEKPVGTICIGVGSRDKIYVKQHQLLKDRMLNIKLTSTIALDSMRKFLKRQLELHPK